jgi:hypothetical protein
VTIAIHGDEFDAAINTGNRTELLWPQWMFKPVIGHRLLRQRNVAELWSAINVKHQITNQHAFEQINPAED